MSRQFVSDQLQQDQLDVMLLGGTVPAEPLYYTCHTKVGGEVCGALVGVHDKTHTHGCPMEDGEPCGGRSCNETGRCQA